jgi:hypothetical protein
MVARGFKGLYEKRSLTVFTLLMSSVIEDSQGCGIRTFPSPATVLVVVELPSGQRTVTDIGVSGAAGPSPNQRAASDWPR